MPALQNRLECYVRGFDFPDPTEGKVAMHHVGKFYAHAQRSR